MAAAPFVLGWSRAREKRIRGRRVGVGMLDGCPGEGRLSWGFILVVGEKKILGKYFLSSKYQRMHSTELRAVFTFPGYLFNENTESVQ